MKTLSIKAKLINCFFAFTLVTGLCVPSLASYAYANPTEGTTSDNVIVQVEERAENSVVDTGVSNDDASITDQNDTDLSSKDVMMHSEENTQSDGAPVQTQSEGIVPLVAVTDWTDVSGSDFQVGSASTQPITIGTSAGDGSDCYFASPILHIQSSKPIAVKNKNASVATSNTIQIDAGVEADLTLAGVNISTSASSPINMITNSMDTASGTKATCADQIIHKTKLYLTLADGTSNSLINTVSGANGWPGIRCGWGSILVIDDEVRNLDTSNQIVTPQNGMIGSDVTLVGGKTVKAGSALVELDSSNPGSLYAQAGGHSAGIGSGPMENAGTLIINGGTISARSLPFNNSNWGYANGSGIGGGSAGSGTVITINGGNVTAQGGSCGTGIGAGFGYYDLSGHHGCTAKADAIAVPSGEANSYGYSWYGYNTSEYLYTGNTVNSPNSQHWHTVAGDISINGGFINAISPQHGNAVGQCCGHGPASNKNHLIKITGGTLITKVSNLNNTSPYLYGIGARLGYTLVTGGSVYVEDGTVGAYKGKPMFQGIGDTAFNTQGINSWSDVTTLGGALPDKDKVQMITIDLSSEFAQGENQTVPIVNWKLEIDNQVQQYGAPSYLNDGKLYLWVPNDATGKNVTVTLSYKDDAGEIHNIEPMYVEEVGGDQGSLLKRYIDINIEELPDEQKAYFASLKKDYDGLPFEAFDIASNPIDTTPFEANGKTLDDASKVTITYQAYDAIDGSPLPGSSVETTGSMPADTGTFRVQLVSKQYAAEGSEFAKSYWGHRITGWAQVNPVPAVLDIEKNGAQWGHLDSDGTWTQITQDQTTQGKAGNRLRLAFTIRSANTTALTCGAPTGSFQVKIDGKNVGEPIALTKEVIEASGGVFDNTSKVEVVGPNGEIQNRNATQVLYYLDPTNQDGLLELLESAGNGGEHTINIEYMADKNYIQGVDKNPENAKDDETFIVPVPPAGGVEPTDPGIEIKDPDPTDPVDPSNPDNPDSPATTIIKKTITVPYSKFHQASNPDLADYFDLEITSSSSAPFSYNSTNPAVAGFVKDDQGGVAFKDDKIGIQVNSCGTSVLTLEQKPNALYTGTKYILTIKVIPDATLVPAVQIRVVTNNLTHPGLPAAPGDEIEYLVTGLNATPGSSWQAAKLLDSIDNRLELQKDSVKLASNYSTPNNAYNLGTEEFYKDFDWTVLSYSDLAQNQYDFDSDANKISKAVGSVYGGQSTTLRFVATLQSGSADRPQNPGDPKPLENEPEGSGGYGKEDTDLQPGEDPTGTTPLVPGKDIIVIGEPDSEDDPTDPDNPGGEDINPIPPLPIIPKDPILPGTDPTNPDDPNTPDTPEPDIYVIKTAKNLTHPEGGKALVGDEVEYTITVGNKGKDTCYYWPVIIDTLPVGLEPIGASFELVRIDGTKVSVADSVYQPSTRTIALYVDDLYGGEETSLTFKCTVTPKATDIANTAQVIGTTPSEKYKEEHNDPNPPAPNPDDLPDIPDPNGGDPDPGDKTQLAYIAFSANGGHFVPRASTQADGGIIVRDDGSPAIISGAPGSQLTSYHHAVFPTADNNPVMDGYDFVEWNTARDGTGDKVSAYPASFSDTPGTTYYYAQWKKSADNTSDDPEKPNPGNDEDDPADLTKHAHIVFAANGGTGAPESISGEPGTKITDTFPLTTPTAKGYTFAGWNTKADGTGDTITSYPESFADTPGTITYYAQWIKNPAPTWPPTPGQPFSPDRNTPADEYPWDDPDNPFDWDKFLEDKSNVDTPEPAVAGKVLPADPDYKDLRITLSAKNETRMDGYTYVGDEVTYTIKIENLSSPEKSWLDVIARADIPEGLDLIPGSIVLTTADGKTIQVSDDVYNSNTRILALNVGDLAGGEVVSVVFKAEVTVEAINKDIGMTSYAYGTLPSEFDAEDETYVKPEPGTAFIPTEGWALFDRTHTAISNVEKVYPSEKVTAQEHVLATPEQQAEADKLAKTGDSTALVAFGIGAIALVAGVVLVVSRRRMKKE